jgi:hypothetical protein
MADVCVAWIRGRGVSVDPSTGKGRDGFVRFEMAYICSDTTFASGTDLDVDVVNNSESQIQGLLRQAVANHINAAQGYSMAATDIRLV